jgi:hypothetical protein
LSLDKLDTLYNHLRKLLGYQVNSRALTVGILFYKREQTVVILGSWLVRRSFTIRDAAELVGSLESISGYHRWGRTCFFTLQNILRSALRIRYHQTKGYYDRHPELATRIRKQLPASLLYRLAFLVDKSMAQLLWNSKVPLLMTPRLSAELTILHDYLSDFSLPWSDSIGHHIPRDPHVVFTGDASPLGGGAYSPALEVWFDIFWSKRIQLGFLKKPSEMDYVHINSLEFIIVILQFAAFIVAMETFDAVQLRRLFPRGIPAEPDLLALTDNTSALSWATKVTTSSLQGQNLVRILGEMMFRSSAGLNGQHIPGEENLVADFISRPSDPYCLDRPFRVAQIYQKYEQLRTWTFFCPNPTLLQSLSSALFSAPWVDRPILPNSLGHFETGASIASWCPKQA